jgi:hypothetical protein
LLDLGFVSPFSSNTNGDADLKYKIRDSVNTAKSKKCDILLKCYAKETEGRIAFYAPRALQR